MEVLPELRSRVARTHLCSFCRGEAISVVGALKHTGFQKPRAQAAAEPQMGRLPNCFISLYRRKGAAKREGCLGHGAQSMLVGTRNNGSIG